MGEERRDIKDRKGQRKWTKLERLNNRNWGVEEQEDEEKNQPRGGYHVGPDEHAAPSGEEKQREAQLFYLSNPRRCIQQGEGLTLFT